MTTSTDHDERPWGSYTVLGSGDRFQVKQITVKPVNRLSYQRHAQRSGHWYVVTGSVQVVLNGVESDVAAGDEVNVPICGLHRIGNNGGTPLIFIEVQRGDYLGEDDIERLEDDFGRV